MYYVNLLCDKNNFVIKITLKNKLLFKVLIV